MNQYNFQLHTVFRLFLYVNGIKHGTYVRMYFQFFVVAKVFLGLIKIVTDVSKKY